MLEVHEQLDQEVSHQHSLTLPFELRQKSRFRARLDNGQEVGLFLPRGRVLRDGALLKASDGSVIKVIAAEERLSSLKCADPLLLARAAYHLGNRHVPLQIRGNQLCYQHDPVLDQMLGELGLKVSVEQSPFEPEAGAYGRGHHHSHASGHHH